MTSNYDKNYSCDQCNYKATKLSHFQQHVKSIHDGIKYPCDQCNHQASNPSHLNRHKKSIHDGVRYPCEQCNYKATQLISLKNHIKSKHIWYDDWIDTKPKIQCTIITW